MSYIGCDVIHRVLMFRRLPGFNPSSAASITILPHLENDDSHSAAWE